MDEAGRGGPGKDCRGNYGEVQIKSAMMAPGRDKGSLVGFALQARGNGTLASVAEDAVIWMTWGGPWTGSRQVTGCPSVLQAAQNLS